MTTTRGAGHFGPLRPFADAFVRDGHDVLVAAPPAAAEMVRRAGHAFRALGAPPDEHRGAVFARTAGASGEEANRIVIGELFAGLDGRAALPGVVSAVEAWRPDAIVHESCEFAAALAGELTGVPTVRVAIGMAALEVWAARFATPHVDAIRAEHGLPADPRGERLGSGPALTLTPPALEDPRTPGGGARFRDAATARARAARRDGERPLVYLSFGSVAGQMGYFPSLYHQAIAELAALPVRVLVTTGNAQDPAALGPLPPNVRAERWVQESFILPHAAAMVSHGGAGSVRMALSAGVPLAVVPLFGDQPFNAHAVARSGAGIAIQGAAGLGVAVRGLLEDPSYRDTAEAIAEEVAALPPAGRAIRLIGQIASRTSPAARWPVATAPLR